MSAAIGGGVKQIRVEVPEAIKSDLNLEYYIYTNGKPAIVMHINDNNYYVYDFEKETGAFAKGKTVKVRSSTYLDLVCNEHAIQPININDFVIQANNNTLINSSKDIGSNFIIGSSNFVGEDKLKNIFGAALSIID